MSVHRLPDRKVPPLFPWTTLEALSNLRKRVAEARNDGMPERKRSEEEWNAFLARELRAEGDE